MGSGKWFRAIINLKRLKIRLSKSVIKNRRRYRGQQLNEDIAATRIQAAFRGYMARKALRRLRGTMRFRGILIDGCYYNQQVSATLKHIHSWSRIQSEMKARRLSMVTEGRLKQKKIQSELKLQAKLHELEVDWSGGSETMEEVLQRIQQREEAAIKRERAMAYAFSHQWRASSSHYFGQAYYDLGKDSWGWSWTERWIAVRPWETRVQAKPEKSPRKEGNQTPNLGPLKLLVSQKSPLTNVKSSAKARKLSGPNAGNQIPKETDT
nr:protein IQ-DOMAIN 1-like isoform X1 [Ipomoea batatas]GME03313.1 protein IQ-DOMAIN 1-like isoform X1 [Ipomoea batatas]